MFVEGFRYGADFTTAGMRPRHSTAICIPDVGTVHPCDLTRELSELTGTQRHCATRRMLPALLTANAAACPPGNCQHDACSQHEEEARREGRNKLPRRIDDMPWVSHLRTNGYFASTQRAFNRRIRDAQDREYAQDPAGNVHGGSSEKFAWTYH